MLKALVGAAAAVIVLPLLALAEPVSKQTLREHRDACVAKCTGSHSEKTCLQLCDCVTDFVAKNWTSKDFEDRSNRLSARASDPEVDRQYREIGKACATR